MGLCNVYVYQKRYRHHTQMKDDYMATGQAQCLVNSAL